jgi:hypothetical protein
LTNAGDLDLQLRNVRSKFAGDESMAALLVARSPNSPDFTDRLSDSQRSRKAL